MRIYQLEEIKNAVEPRELIKVLEDGFVAFSQGRVVVPPVGHLSFEEAAGDCHIKYGYIKGDDYFVVKIATGFPNNPNLNLPVGNGLMVLLSRKTGSVEALLLDEGYLTDLRTAGAGAVTAKYLAPKKIARIGIIGTGVQARMQLEMLKNVTECRDVMVWGRDEAKSQRYRSEMERHGFRIAVADNFRDLTESCDLIITTTSAHQALFAAEDIRPGTQITAVGADAPGKQELDPNLFRRADVCVVDSLSQCVDHGDASYAVKAGLIQPSELVELGSVIENPELGRTNDQQITLADLTGVAVQDIKIAELVVSKLSAA